MKISEECLTPIYGLTVCLCVIQRDRATPVIENKCVSTLLCQRPTVSVGLQGTDSRVNAAMKVPVTFQVFGQVCFSSSSSPKGTCLTSCGLL